MKIGTIETIEEKEQKRKIKSNLSSGSGSNNGKRKGGGGGGSDDGNQPGKDFNEDTTADSNDKFRIGMWFLLLVVLMTFGGLIGTYIVLATNSELEWRPFDLPKQIWLSTVFILISSVTYQISKRALISDNQQKSKNWLLATTFFGAAFISSQILSWFELVQKGVYIASNPYAGFFYILTAVHALHVLGGILVLGYMLLRTWHKTNSDDELEKRKAVSGAVAIYWHFMDALWIVLFILLGFWK